MAKAIGVYGFVASAGGSIGLVAGGVLTEAISWHWIFFINVPIGIATALATTRLVPDKPGLGMGAGADYPGAVLATAGLMLFVYAILGVSEEGVGSTRVLVPGAIAIALLGAFLLRQSRIANPLMPLRLFAIRNVAGANLVMAPLVAGMFSMFFLGALYLQRVLGYNPLEVGLAFLPSSVLMGIISLRLTERLTMRFGARGILLPGVVSIGIGLLLFARTPVDGNFWVDVLPPTLFIGVGAGLSFPSLMSLAMSGVEMQDSGLASGIVNSTVQVGGAIGLAVLATLSASRSDSLRDGGETAAAALNGGYHVAYLVGAGLVVVALAAAIGVLRPAPVAEAEAATEPEMVVA